MENKNVVVLKKGLMENVAWCFTRFDSGVPEEIKSFTGKTELNHKDLHLIFTMLLEVVVKMGLSENAAAPIKELATKDPHQATFVLVRGLRSQERNIKNQMMAEDAVSGGDGYYVYGYPEMDENWE